MNILRDEKTVVQTTSWPMRSASAPISWDIGTLETATGVQKQETKVAKCAPLNLLSNTATLIPIKGTITVLLIVPIIMCFFNVGIADSSNLAPNTRRERGVATLERFWSDL